MAKAKTKNDSGANLGFEAKLWLTADKMRNNMDAAEYKHVVLRLIFLKYISDAFEEHHEKLEIEADIVDCMVALPAQLFYSTQIPVCLWFLARNKSGKSPSPRTRGEGRGGSRRWPPIHGPRSSRNRVARPTSSLPAN
jgi:type I restriction-modification system DNA methylase subunit